MPESVLSRLARSTELSKTESHSAGAARIQSSSDPRRTCARLNSPRRLPMRGSDCPRNLVTIPCCAKPCQRVHPTEFPPHFHSWIFRMADGRAEPRRLLIERATVWPSASIALISAHAEAEDRKLRKELSFGGPCLEGTLQKPTLVSESSPVAGAIRGWNSSL